MGKKLLGKLILNFKLKVMTGLHIGAGADIGRIGEIDLPVVKLKLEEDGVYYPYIPGSSLKGKLRHLYELEKEKIDSDKVHSCDEKDCEVCQFFGSRDQGIGRFIFRDLDPTDESKRILKNLYEEEGAYEVKMENVIDRGSAQAKHPRQIERVPKGIEFEGEIVVNIFEEEDKEKAKKVLDTAFQLLEDDYLGGSGTRGYGKVEIEDKKWVFRSNDYYLGKAEEEKIDD